MKASEARALTEASLPNTLPLYRRMIDKVVEREANAGNSSASIPSHNLGVLVFSTSSVKTPGPTELKMLQEYLVEDGYTVRLTPPAMPGQSPTLIVSW